MSIINPYAHNQHYEWIEQTYKVKCSPLGREVANILGYVNRGLRNYGLSRKVDWTHDYVIVVGYRKTLSNFDSSALTDLVVECHKRMIRVEIEPCNFNQIRLMFHQRKTREGCTTERMPTIEEMVARNAAEWLETKGE